MAKLNIENNHLIQSTQIRIEATGSTGDDNTILGHHLRWDFRNNLGNNHLARGSYNDAFLSVIPINENSDYINILKTPFSKKYYTEVNFAHTPDIEIVEGDIRRWVYTIVVNGLDDSSNIVNISFLNTSVYDQIRSSQSTLDTVDFLNQYADLIEISIENSTLFFSYEFDNVFQTNGILRVESISNFNSLDPSSKRISSRKLINTNYNEFYSENTESLRFDYNDCRPSKLYLITYKDFIFGVNQENESNGNWTSVGQFSLTVDDDIALSRLQSNQIDSLWPKYIAGSSNEFTINASNYSDRWEKENGIKSMVNSYLEKSMQQPKGLLELASADSNDNTHQIISTLDILQLLSLDYHVARILGLGHIESEENEGRFIYAMQYSTYCDFLNNIIVPAPETTHIYLSLPTSLSDKRLPATPDLQALSFGLTVDNGTANPIQLTDAQGYAKFGNARFININRKYNEFEKAISTFFSNPTEFSLSSQSQPIAFGIKYKRDGEPTYQIPELNHDKIYFDNQSIAETIPALNTGLKIYTHQEKEEGIHKYAVYSINWFSRASSLTNELSAETQFPPQAHLLPPFNLYTQLIQDEDPSESDVNKKVLVFTTPAEQTILTNHNATSSDSTLLRVSFDWNHVHNNAHQFADYAEILFRKNDPLVVKGKIASVQDLGDETVQVTTQQYQNSSKSVPGKTVQPSISSADKDRFIGAYFSCGDNNYRIKNVIANGNNPSFIVETIKTTEAFPQDTQNQNVFTSNESYESPQTGDLFFVIENLGNEENWDLLHTRKIYLEKFYSNSKVILKNTYINFIEGVFAIDNVVEVSGKTEISVAEDVKLSSATNLALIYYTKHSIYSITANTIQLNGDLVDDFIGNSFRIFGSLSNDGKYNVQNATLSGGITTVTLVSGEGFSDVTTNTGKSGNVQIEVERPLTNIDPINNKFEINGSRKSEINFAPYSYKTESDGSKTRFVNGGIVDTVTFIELIGANGEATGYLQIDFDNFVLQNHPDPEVIWDKGTIRLTDIDGNTQPYSVAYIGDLAITNNTALSLVIQDPAFVPDQSGSGTYSLDIYNGNTANYHPSYKVYLKSDNGIDSNGNAIPTNGIHFNEESIFPSSTNLLEGNRKTFIGIRSIDIKKGLNSFISPPSVVIAQRFSIPVQPDQPTGPKYATRPNFFGKSTYTFDVKINSIQPYSVVFYRGNEDLILKTLYKKTTIESIWNSINAFTNPDLKYDFNLWNILFSVQLNTGNTAFVEYSNTGFIWPNPDNDGYIIPYEAREELTSTNVETLLPNGLKKPFAGGLIMGGSNNIYPNVDMEGIDIIKQAILSAFVPLNEQAPVFNDIKTGMQTSGEKPIFRDTDGNILDPNANDLYPMIKKHTDGSDTYLRFTDYSLDGGSTNMYFYLAIEMSDKFKFSSPSLPIGPVIMVNSNVIDKPQIRKVTTQLPDAFLGIDAAVLFDVNKYLDSEGVCRFKLYRCIGVEDSYTIRTMQYLKSFDINEQIIDDFSTDTNPLFGEELFYRIVAVKVVKEIQDVINNSQPEIIEIESLPSDTAKITLADSINPDAPSIQSSNIVDSSISRNEYLNRVVLKWDATCYNGKYTLQKLNSKGNWTEIYSTTSKDESMQYPPLDSSQNPDFTNFTETALLERKDSNGNKLYHRYRVVVENSSGLFNSSQNEITLATGLNDLARINDFFSFEDNSQLHSLDTLNNIAFIDGSCSPEFMTFKFLGFVLPAGHNTVLSIAITLKDDLGNESTKTVSNPSFNTEISFNSADGLQMDSSNPNRIYTVTTAITTDFVDIDNNAIASFNQVFIIDYLNGRYNNNWIQRMDMQPIVTESATVSVKDKIYVIGGKDEENNLNSVREYDFTSNDVVEKNDWEDRVQCLAVEYENEVYVIGGYQGDPANIVSELNKYDSINDSWSVLNNLPFYARLNAVFVNYEGKLFYGLGENEYGDVYSDWWEYDIDNNSWTAKNSAPTPITQASYFILHGGIYIIGGKTDNGETFESWRYVIDGGNWVQIAPLPNPNNENGLFQSAGFANDDKYGYVCGGANSSTVFSQDVWRYCFESDEWCKVSVFNGEAARIQSSIVIIENRAYVIGGYKQDGTICDEIWEFTF